jgi:hypothetical protein
MQVRDFDKKCSDDSYDIVYDPIYDSSYGVCFIFSFDDEDDDCWEEEDFFFGTQSEENYLA